MSEFPQSSPDVPVFWPKLEFSLFLIGQIFSIPCYLFIFYHILFKSNARKSLQNHGILILLLYNFIHIMVDLSLTQNYTRLGYNSLFHPVVCLIWQFVDYGIWYGAISLMLWVSIERHILIFHSSLVQTIRYRILFHYIPLLITAAYAPTLYLYLIVLSSCNRTYNQKRVLCGSLCYRKIVPSWFNLYDSFVDYIIPIVLIVFFSVSLFLRFIKQKQRLRRTLSWRQCRRMLIQLLLVSTVYVVCDLPYVIIYIVQLSGFPNFGSGILMLYVARLTYVPAIVVPYAILMGLPELKEKLHALSFWKRRNIRRIRPTNT